MASVATTDNAPASPRRILLVSVPRTASNLMVKILNIPGQPVVTNDKAGYFFYESYNFTRENRPKKPLAEWTTEERDKIRAPYQRAIDAMEERSAQALEQGKMMFAKEHAFWFSSSAISQAAHDGSSEPSPEGGEAMQLRFPAAYGAGATFSPANSTMLSDEYLRSWRMAFIIRHPALAFPSLYRAVIKVAALGIADDDGIKGATVTNMSLRWTRSLYDWCLEQPDMPAPALVDANDVIHNPKVMVRFCELVGLDANALQFEWKQEGITPIPTANETMKTAFNPNFEAAAKNIMLSTLLESTTIRKDKAPVDIDIAAEADKWKVELGDEAAALIEKAVREAMPDYEYLKARRLTA